MVLVIGFIDNCSRFTKSQLISNIQATKVTNTFEKTLIQHYGSPPDIIVCDHGVQYTSKSFKNP